MTQINLSNIIFHSGFSGFSNYTTTSLALSVPSTVVGLSPSVYTGSVAISNANSLSQVEAQLTGLDTNWYIFKGFMGNFYTSGNAWTNKVSNASYEVDLNTSYTATSLVLTVTLYNLTLNNTYTTPAFTVNCNASLYIAPF